MTGIQYAHFPSIHATLEFFSDETVEGLFFSGY